MSNSDTGIKTILILAANPKDTSKLRLDEEVREIQAALERSRLREEFQLITRWAVRVDDLRRALLDNNPQIVHFSGHGAGTDGLALENSFGEVQLIETEALSNLFQLFQHSVTCVLLNACYSQVQSDAIHQYINCVIGMKKPINDKGAINFSKGFYDAIFAGRNYTDAFTLGCNNIDFNQISESNIPVLKIREDIKKSDNTEKKHKNSSQSNPKNRVQEKLLKQVTKEVKIRINSSLHNRVYIVQNLEQNPSQVELPWDMEVKVSSRYKIQLKNTEITTVYDSTDIDGRLLILGEPGTGKTTMLLKLACELVKRAQDDSSHPIPVLFSLSSWNKENQSIKDWLVEQLKEKYGVRKDIGKQWVENQEILPLLDGLDEVAAELQEKCALKINEFLHPSHWMNPVVVCSRIQEYQRYTTLLQLNNSLELYPFTSEQVYQYLERTENVQLWDSISDDADLNQLAKTPLLLNIIVLSAQEISVQTWKEFSSSEERLSYLFDAYIRRMLKRRYSGKQPTPKQTQRWLGWLAQRLIEESVTEFFIERMQPNWLRNKVPKVVYNLFFWGVIGALIYGLINGLINGLYGLIEGLIYGLICGLINGLINGLIGELIEKKIETTVILINHRNNFNKIIIKWLIIGLINGLIYGLYGLSNGLINGLYGLSNGLINGLIYGLIYGLINGLIYGLIYGLFSGLIGDEIQPIEKLKYSMKKLLNGLKLGLIIGLIIGLFSGLIYGLFSGLINGLISGLINGLISGLIIGLIFGLIFGIDGLEVENKSIPNQGIRQSFINTVLISMGTCLLSTLLIFLIIKTTHQGALSISLVSGLSLGLLIAIPRSGTPAIKHFVLRVILWVNGYMPWNYAKFLDYCTNRLFLQRVGGGYRFIHDLLRQHFAKSYTQKHLVSIPEIPIETSLLAKNLISCSHCAQNNPANFKYCMKCGIQLTKPHP